MKIKGICIITVMLLAAIPGTSPGLPPVEKPAGEVLEGIPEAVVWSPGGDSVLLSVINDELNTAAVSEVIVETGERRDYPVPGPIRAFSMNPDGELLATIHEERRERVLLVWDRAEKAPKEVYRDTGNLYFPVVNTVSPWDPAGERLVFYRARFHERHLHMWKAGSEVVEVTEERRSDRAFWGPGGRLLVPQGVAFERVLAGELDLLTGLVEIDFAGKGRSLRPLPGGYPNIFPYSRVGVAILKDEVVAPLVLDLATWETKPLPDSVDRYLDLTWSPGGSKLAYPLNGRGYNRIVTYDVESGTSRLLWVDEDYLAGSLDWSPSGEYLAVSLLAGQGRRKALALVLEAGTGERVWSRDRDPGIVEQYFHRGRKSLRWHPTEDTLLLWEPEDTAEEVPGVALRTVKFDD